MTFQLEVEILPKAGMLDPQGDAVERSLKALGFAQVHTVRVGRLISLALEADTEDEARALGAEMAEALLANPVMETFRLEVSG